MDHKHVEYRIITIDDAIEAEDNIIKIKENPNSEQGTSSIIWECVTFSLFSYR